MKDFIKVIMVDFLALVIGFVNGLIVPRYLDLDSYATIKTFTLYVSYAGMLHVGFSDGMYIILGGKRIQEIGNGKIKGYLLSLLKILLIVFPFLFIVNVTFIRDNLFNLFLIYAFPYQISLFLSLLYRATGEFEKYIKIRIMINGINLFSALLVIFNTNPYIYIGVQIIGYILLSVVCIIQLARLKGAPIHNKGREVLELIKIGFIIMIANTVNNLMFTLDRWFIKLFFNTAIFAFYSFSVTMLNLFITLINSITIVFYPFIAKAKMNWKEIDKIKKYLIIITSFVPAGYFIFDYIITEYLPKYQSSLNILFVLILSIPFLTLNNVIFANLYKIQSKGRLYLTTSITMLAISLVLNGIAVKLFSSELLVAWCTVITLFLWYCIASYHFPQIRIDFKECLLYIGCITIYFLVYTTIPYWICKVLIYIVLVIILNISIYKNSSKDLIIFLKTEFLKKIKR